MKRSSQSITYLSLALVSLLSALCCSCAALGKTSSAPPGLNRSSKVLVIGDSLTCGPFGDKLESWLLENLGPSRVAVYASCGSSPESWLASEKDFYSPCGYRETTTQVHITDKSSRGRRPTPVRTPKIEELLAKHQPQIVIIQLGTNHFDSVLHDGKEAIPKLAKFYENFANALTRRGGPVRMVVWVTPPDSSKFPKWIQEAVDEMIISNNKRHSFGSVVSRGFTHYVPGVTGSDGVHYNDAGAAPWAANVIRRLDVTFTRYQVKN